MADTVIESLITKLGFDFDDEELDKFDEAIEDGVKGLTAMVVAATAAATAIFLFTKNIAAANDETGKFANKIGIDIAALQELGFVAELNGGSIDSMNTSLANLSRITSEAARGLGAGVEVFGMLGLSATDAEGRIKSADDMIMEISDSIAGLDSQAQRLEFAQKLGIGEDLLLSIQQGSKALKEQRKEARELGFIIDNDAFKAAERFNDEMLRIIKIAQGVSSAIGTRLMKVLLPMTKQFIAWFKINKDIIKQNLTVFLERAVKVLRGVFNIAMRVVNVILGLVDAMGGWKNSIIAVTALLLAMNASALLMPILMVAAGAGILLLIEDIQKFAEGGDSVLGDLANRFPVFDALLRTTLDLLTMVAEGWELIFTQGDEAFEGAMMMLKDFGQAIKDFVLTPFTKIESFFANSPLLQTGRQEPGRATAGAPGVNGAPGAPGASGGGARTQSIVLNINGGNLDEVKRVVADVLSEEYSGAQTNLKSQVDY